MQYEINDINLLPIPTQLRKISQSLAMLDAIMMPEWDYRYFSFDAHWDDDNEEMMASMRTGEGDEYYILFCGRNALGKVYSSDAVQMPQSKIDKLEDKVPYMLTSFMDEEAFDVNNASFFFWYVRADKNWICTKEEGNLEYLKFLEGDAEFYKEWAEGYYEKSIDLDVVKKIMKHSPLTSAMVEKLNPQITLKELSEDIEEIGYPLWKKKGKRKTLPDDFEALLETGDIDNLKKVFDTCELDAYNKNDYCKPVAIAHDDCPDELARWLVEQGADLHKENPYGNTPLHMRAGSWGSIKVLLELGADVSRQNKSLSGSTALHYAADRHNSENIKLLLNYGAKVNEKDSDEMTALEYALLRCTNSTIKYMVETSEVLLNHGADITPKTKEYIKKLGEEFEFHRGTYNKESVDSVDKSLGRLYELFDVKPVQKRVMHDGKSEIIIKEKKWQKQFNELWDMLVPSSGHADTVQGEVIRIAGRIADEVERNGGANWDSEYKKMGNAYLKHVATGEPLSESEIAKLSSMLRGLESLYGQTDNLAKYAVIWVGQNTMPIGLGKIDYDR